MRPVFVGVAPIGPPNAFASAPSKIGRYIALCGEVTEPIALHTVLYDEAQGVLDEAWKRRYGGQSGSSSTEEMFRMIAAVATDSADAFGAIDVLRRCGPWIRSIYGTGPGEQMDRHLFEFLAARASAAGAGGLAFVLAHEYGHHLLGHTHGRGHGVLDLSLSDWLAGYRADRLIHAPSNLNVSQLQELDADLFAFVLLGGGLSGRPSSRDGWNRALVGSMVGLRALALFSRGGDRMMIDGKQMERPGATHPPFDVRLAQIYRTVMSTMLDRELGPGDNGHPIMLMLRLMGHDLMITQWLDTIISVSPD